MPILAALTALMKLWMVVDAMKQCRCGSYWPWIILFVPGGEWAYFFVVKIHDAHFYPLRRWVNQFASKLWRRGETHGGWVESQD
jgi:hypothetical protein